MEKKKKKNTPVNRSLVSVIEYVLISFNECLTFSRVERFDFGTIFHTTVAGLVIYRCRFIDISRRTQKSTIHNLS